MTTGIEDFTDLAAGLRGADGQAVGRDALARLDALEKTVAGRMSAGVDAATYAELDRLRGAVVAARDVIRRMT